MRKTFNDKSQNQNTLIYISLVIVSFLFLLFTFYDPSNSNRTGKAVYNLSTQVLLSEFKENEAAANNKYLKKLISVSGYVTEISDGEIRLDDDVVCSFDGKEKEKLATLRRGEIITVKGNCDGKFLWTVHLQYCIIE
jgi:hypothetical protein